MDEQLPYFENLFLLVSDLDESKAFYRDKLRLHPEYQGDNFVILRGAGGSRILLHDAEGEPVEPGSFEMEIRVDDVDRWYREVSGGGVRVRREPFRVSHEGDPWSPRRETRLADPDGYGVILFSPLQSK